MNEAGGGGNLLVALGAVAGALSVAAGALGAHAIAEMVTPERLATFRNGATYGLVHSLAAVAAGLARPAAGRLAGVAGWLFLSGVLLFSGSLFALVLLDAPTFGAIAPVGGAAFIAGWLALGHGAFWNRAKRIA